MAAPTPRVIVVGAGIGGLVTALSVHEIGMRVDVYERAMVRAANWCRKYDTNV